MLKIEYLPIGEIKPYKRNAKKHPPAQVEQIAESIKQMGFNDPIAIWRGEIVEGHGRYLAAKSLGMTTLPVIRLDELTNEQRKAYTLIHNKLTMNSGFDMDILSAELAEISGIDMTTFDFELPDIEIEEDTRDPSCQHNVFENQELMQFPITNYYGIPNLNPTQTTGNKFLRFMDWKEVSDYENYIAHFYYDDYKFIAAWREPEKYLDMLKRFKAVVCPDFSSYTDFPIALQILGAYRRNWCGAYWQYHGIDVIPDVQWGNEETYKWCFEGIPKNATVAISSVGVASQGEWNNKEGTLFKNGFEKMMEVLHPKTILWYGDLIDGCSGNIIHIPSYYAERRDNWGQKEAFL